MRSNKLLKIMYVFTWIAFIGLCVQSGVLLTSYFFSFSNPEVAKTLFGGINLFQYYNYSFYHYSFILFYKIMIGISEAWIAYLLIRLLKDLDIANPFNKFVCKLMKQTSISVLCLWFIVMLHNTHVQFIGKKYNFEMDLYSSEFLFVSGVLFIFSQIIKRGIEIQQENDLTI